MSKGCDPLRFLCGKVFIASTKILMNSCRAGVGPKEVESLDGIAGHPS